ncbi:ferric-chelate reductase [Verticillium alfalfae VaMs.102]|uniref:Ferric-chelate reductase n=1 Tax=Verticillium alfalfae (strain VaMs.102 / ATCC MYA-4576 / FGSC 10136) TaxID=526221 RepID=C9SF21_VERA1|nr:ferric-chelate reductase [Verticillium alfalfae VaMs.102]EEY17807.1 ferric-chelate reductase [Verticillium alfalfae VaMs.102]
MRRPPSSSLLLPLLAATTCILPAAQALGEDLTFGSCELALAYVHFDDVGTNASKLAQRCESRDRILSLYLCLKVHGAEGVGIPGLRHENETCQAWRDTPLPPFDIVDAYSDDDIAQLRHIGLDEQQNGAHLDEVIMLSETLYRAAFDTLDAVEYVYYNHYIYGMAMIFFWIAVVALGVLSRLMSAIGDAQRSVNLGWCTIPPRIQSLTLLAFIGMNVFLSLYGYRFTENNLYFGSLERQIWRYGSDRTGIISFFNFPVIWLFAMRNNLVIWLTGWDFGSYNNFHRWVARVATLQAVLHSIGYTILIIKALLLDRRNCEHALPGQPIQVLLLTCLQATVLMCLLLGFSVYWLRRKHYETFLILHIVLSIFVLLTMLGHVSIFKGQYDMLAWIPAMVWGLDRIIRMSRTLAFNPRFWNTWASATYDPSSNMIRLVVPHSSSVYTPQPGTYYYLHVLSDTKFWESHPFTMAYSTGSRRRPSKDLSEDTPLMDNQNDISLASEADGEDPAMTFLIRPYDSFTSRLRDAAGAHWPAPAPLRILVEGPYGHTQPFHTFENLLFLVGGSGIVVPLAYLHALVASPRTKSIRIVWASRERGFAEDVVKHDLGPLVGCDKVSVTICITHREDFADDALSALPKTALVRYGRPDVPREVEDAVVRGAGWEPRRRCVRAGAHGG